MTETTLPAPAAPASEPATDEGPTVVVWGKPRCVQCQASERDLEAKGIPFETRSLPDHPDMLEHFKAMNMLQAPVVTFEDMIWSGFQPDKHNEVRERLATA